MGEPLRDWSYEDPEDDENANADQDKMMTTREGDVESGCCDLASACSGPASGQLLHVE